MTKRGKKAQYKSISLFHYTHELPTECDECKAVMRGILIFFFLKVAIPLLLHAGMLEFSCNLVPKYSWEVLSIFYKEILTDLV